ncbi:MAG: hypothetical protein RBR40_01335 [Tenuifilaceae bacterium]|nr:hypothetical protein [Tenuifilaceae bacterium]
MNIIIKKSIVILGLVAFATALTLLGGCKSANENNRAAKVDKAAENLIEARQNYIEEYEAFKPEANIKIEANEKAIAKLKEDGKNKSKANKAILDKKLAALELKNQELKDKIRDSKEDGNERWEAFKLEFKYDMDNLGQALKDLTTNNTK